MFNQVFVRQAHVKSEKDKANTGVSPRRSPCMCCYVAPGFQLVSQQCSNEPTKKEVRVVTRNTAWVKAGETRVAMKG